MSSFNKVILLGNLTRDPEVYYTTGGTAVATFAIAVNSKYTDRGSGEVKEKVDYVDIVVYGKSADHCGQYLHKGDPVLIDGRINQRRWDDKSTGQKRSKHEIIANPYNGIIFMPRRKPSAGSGDSAGDNVPDNVKGAFPGAHEVDTPPIDEDPIPF